jgi:glycosyltransferase involved in cell wall biosynthesis
MTDHADRPIRVLQLASNDKLGGVSVLMEIVETGLRARGFDVDTLALSTGRGVLAIPSDLMRPARAILSGRYDAVLSYQAAASIFGNVLAWLRRVPLRAAHHTAAPEGIRAHWRLIDRLLGSAGITTHYIANSQATTDAFASWPERYRKRFVAIPHGIDPVPEATGAIDWRKRLDIRSDAPVLLATGRLVDQKDHATAVKAMAQLPGAHLIIAGDGPNGDALAALARELAVADRVHLLGSVDRAQLGDLFAASSVYVFPSIWETFGLAGVEAAMAGLPIVASDLSVLREVLDLGDPGDASMVRFHRVRDPGSLAAAVKATLDAYPPVSDRSAFASRHREHHSQARMMAGYETFLRKTMAR